MLLVISLGFALDMAEAQQNRATVFGTVTDATGAAVSGARMSVMDIRTNAAFSTVTNQEGFYSSPGLAVGEYQVTGEHGGFKKAVRRGITLEVDQRAQVDLVMEVGSVSESVEVVGQAPLVDTGERPSAR
jgi:hypothetical protein